MIQSNCKSDFLSIERQVNEVMTMYGNFLYHIFESFCHLKTKTGT